MISYHVKHYQPGRLPEKRRGGVERAKHRAGRGEKREEGGGAAVCEFCSRLERSASAYSCVFRRTSTASLSSNVCCQMMMASDVMHRAGLRHEHHVRRIRKDVGALSCALPYKSRLLERRVIAYPAHPSVLTNRIQSNV